MSKVLATSPKGRTLVERDGDVRIHDEADVRAAEPVSSQLKKLILDDPSYMDFVDLNHYGQPEGRSWHRGMRWKGLGAVGARTNGPDISVKGNILGARDLKVEEPSLLNEGRGLKRESKMCEKAGTPEYRCGVELEFLTEEDARGLKLPPDTRVAVHKCVRPGSSEGAFVPVQSAHEALRVSNEYCACVDEGTAAPKPVVVPEKVLVRNDVARQKCARAR